MIWILLWAIIGIVVGLSQANIFLGPQDTVLAALAWALGWPILLFLEWPWR